VLSVIHGEDHHQGSQHVGSKATENFLRDVFSAADGLGGVPVVIAGDFNADSARSAVLTSVTASGQWTDLAVAAAQVRGSLPD